MESEPFPEFGLRNRRVAGHGNERCVTKRICPRASCPVDHVILRWILAEHAHQESSRLFASVP
jgi:hypothetical protein